MLEDAGVDALVTREAWPGIRLRRASGPVCLDADRPRSSAAAAADLSPPGAPGQPGLRDLHLGLDRPAQGRDGRRTATSSTSSPAWTACLGGPSPGCWLAVTSISFDISVLELFWTLARGFTVVVQPTARRRRRGGGRARRRRRRSTSASSTSRATRAGSGGATATACCSKGAKFADRHGFAAVWTPERHFHAFGGLYPNPAVTSAALAAVTERVADPRRQRRAAAAQPDRVAEEWSVVDNLSNGRVGLSFASGWHADDFVLAPGQLRRAQGGDAARASRRCGGSGAARRCAAAAATGRRSRCAILPRPVQRSCRSGSPRPGSPETFALAGRDGRQLLTHLLGQSARGAGGEDRRLPRGLARGAATPGEGHVTLMLHTFVGDDLRARPRDRCASRSSTTCAPRST